MSTRSKIGEANTEYNRREIKHVLMATMIRKMENPFCSSQALRYAACAMRFKEFALHLTTYDLRALKGGGSEKRMIIQEVIFIQKDKEGGKR